MLNKERNPFSQFLIDYRKTHKLTVEQMSNKLALAKNQYSRYENGDGFPINYNIKKIKNLEGVNADELYISLLNTDKYMLKARFSRLLKNADVTNEDLLKIILILEEYL